MSISILDFLKIFKHVFFITISLSLKCTLTGRAATLSQDVVFSSIDYTTPVIRKFKMYTLAQWLNFKNIK